MTLKNTLSLSIFLHSCVIGTTLIVGASLWVDTEDANSLNVLMVSLPARSTMDANKNIRDHTPEIISEKKEVPLKPLLSMKIKLPVRVQANLGRQEKVLEYPPTTSIENDPNVLKTDVWKEPTPVIETPPDEIIEALSQTVSSETSVASKAFLPEDSVLISSLLEKGKETDLQNPPAVLDVCASTLCQSLMDDFIQEVREKLQRSKRYPWLGIKKVALLRDEGHGSSPFSVRPFF